MSTNIKTDTANDTLLCPFVYSTGTGGVSGCQVYGHRSGESLYNAPCVRVWCDHKWDHTGGGGGKQRMEFPPRNLSKVLYERVEASL
jgi:hypothetical protein